MSDTVSTSSPFQAGQSPGTTQCIFSSFPIFARFLLFSLKHYTFNLQSTCLCCHLWAYIFWDRISWFCFNLSPEGLDQSGWHHTRFHYIFNWKFSLLSLCWGIVCLCVAIIYMSVSWNTWSRGNWLRTLPRRTQSRIFFTVFRLQCLLSLLLSPGFPYFHF